MAHPQAHAHSISRTQTPVKSCATCIFFTEQTDMLGLCRKNPPTVVVVEIAKPTDDKYTRPFTTWPLVRTFDWCGDHAYKDERR